MLKIVIKADADITKIPHKSVCGNTADKQHYKCKNLVSGLETPLVTEQVGNVASTMA